MLHDLSRRVSRRIQARVSERMCTAKQERCERPKQCANTDHDCTPQNAHTFSASEESTIARWLCRAMYRTLVMPSTLSSLPAGTTIGPP
jgi:hypothetical protein